MLTGLSATIWFTQKKEPPKGPPLTTLSADAVTGIRIEHPNEPTITLEKKGAEWQLTEPVQSPTDPFEVASLVNLATTEIKHAMKVSDVKLADLKLDPPQFTITLNDQKRSEEHTSELHSLMRTSYAVISLKKNTKKQCLNKVP